MNGIQNIQNGELHNQSLDAAVREAEAYGWTLTDDDSYQWQRGIIDETFPLAQCFEMCQITKLGEKYGVSHGNVRIGMMPYEELEELVKLYGYSGLDDFVQQTVATNEFVLKADGTIDRENSPSWILEYGLLAEMNFETLALDDFMPEVSFDSFEEAESYILQHILHKPGVVW